MKTNLDCIFSGHVEGPQKSDSNLSVTIEEDVIWSIRRCGRCKNFYIKTIKE